MTAAETLKEATALVVDAHARDIVLRIVGSAAVGYFGQAEGQRPVPIKDIDLVTYRGLQERAQAFLLGRAWNLREEFLMFSESRETYSNEVKTYSLDLYYDRIDGNHPIDLSATLEASFPTVSWTDLLLTKLQRVKLRPQDIWDICALLGSVDQFDRVRFATLLGQSWGLYTTVVRNLTFLLESSDVNRASAGHLLLAAETCEKRLGWRMRAIVGPRVRWWKEMYGARLLTK
jgi:hypothetical protein